MKCCTEKGLKSYLPNNAREHSTNPVWAKSFLSLRTTIRAMNIWTSRCALFPCSTEGNKDFLPTVGERLRKFSFCAVICFETFSSSWKWGQRSRRLPGYPLRKMLRFGIRTSLVKVILFPTLFVICTRSLYDFSVARHEAFLLWTLLIPKSPCPEHSFVEKVLPLIMNEMEISFSIQPQAISTALTFPKNWQLSIRTTEINISSIFLFKLDLGLIDSADINQSRAKIRI